MVLFLILNLFTELSIWPIRQLLCSSVKLKHTLVIFLENVFTVKQISLIWLTEWCESTVLPVSELSYLRLVTAWAWSVLFTLAQHASFSPSFSSPSLKLLLPIHLFNSGSSSWATYHNSFYIIRNEQKMNVHCTETCIIISLESTSLLL